MVFYVKTQNLSIVGWDYGYFLSYIFVFTTLGTCYIKIRKKGRLMAGAMSFCLGLLSQGLSLYLHNWVSPPWLKELIFSGRPGPCQQVGHDFDPFPKSFWNPPSLPGFTKWRKCWVTETESAPPRPPCAPSLHFFQTRPGCHRSCGLATLAKAGHRDR